MAASELQGTSQIILSNKTFSPLIPFSFLVYNVGKFYAKWFTIIISRVKLVKKAYLKGLIGSFNE